MKKLILLCMIIGFALSINAQVGQVSMTNANGSTLDTLSNTTAEGCYILLKGKGIQGLSLTIDMTTITGTVAGKVYLASGAASGKRGINYLDSAVLSAGSNAYTFERSVPSGQYYWLWVVPTGTQSTSYRGYAYIRRE